jgi:hypothetical protein
MILEAGQSKSKMPASVLNVVRASFTFSQFCFSAGDQAKVLMNVCKHSATKPHYCATGEGLLAAS